MKEEINFPSHRNCFSILQFTLNLARGDVVKVLSLSLSLYLCFDLNL